VYLSHTFANMQCSFILRLAPLYLRTYGAIQMLLLLLLLLLWCFLKIVNAVLESPWKLLQCGFHNRMGTGIAYHHVNIYNNNSIIDMYATVCTVCIVKMSSLVNSSFVASNIPMCEVGETIFWSTLEILAKSLCYVALTLLVWSYDL